MEHNYKTRTFKPLDAVDFYYKIKIEEYSIILINKSFGNALIADSRNLKVQIQL